MLRKMLDQAVLELFEEYQATISHASLFTTVGKLNVQVAVMHNLLVSSRWFVLADYFVPYIVRY